jgi:flagellar biosynthesis/type III secretory pathway protein FliH
MKNKEEIEQLADFKYQHFTNEATQNHFKLGFYDGYNQCQEEMAKELEMHILVNEHDWTRNPQAQLKDLINSLNKQD